MHKCAHIFFFYWNQNVYLVKLTELLHSLSMYHWLGITGIKQKRLIGNNLIIKWKSCLKFWTAVFQLVATPLSMWSLCSVEWWNPLIQDPHVALVETNSILSITALGYKEKVIFVSYAASHFKVSQIFLAIVFFTFPEPPVLRHLFIVGTSCNPHFTENHIQTQHQ